MTKPFRRIASQVVVANRWHRYCRDRYTHKDGTEGEYYYVDIPGSAAVIPLFADGSTALVRVYRYLLETALWEFPIGGMQPGEPPLAVAQRELEEEAGLVAEAWIRLGSVAPYKGVSNEVCHYFLARDLRWTEQQLEPSEEISVHPMSIAEARHKLVEQDPGDGQSWAGLLLLERWQTANRSEA